jgi:hypothetical protein
LGKTFQMRLDRGTRNCSSLAIRTKGKAAVLLGGRGKVKESKE